MPDIEDNIAAIIMIIVAALTFLAFIHTFTI